MIPRSVPFTFDPIKPLILIHVGMKFQRLFEDLFDGPARVERIKRILKNDLHVRAVLPEFLPADAREINGPMRCQWVSHHATLRWDQLKGREKYGYNHINWNFTFILQKQSE